MPPAHLLHLRHLIKPQLSVLHPELSAAICERVPARWPFKDQLMQPQHSLGTDAPSPPPALWVTHWSEGFITNTMVDDCWNVWSESSGSWQDLGWADSRVEPSDGITHLWQSPHNYWLLMEMIRVRSKVHFWNVERYNYLILQDESYTSIWAREYHAHIHPYKYLKDM